MKDGTRRAIKDIRTGQKVLATDPRTGVTHARVVTKVITGEGQKNLIEVTVDIDGKVGSVTATAGHPFWVNNQQRWLNAAGLKVGDRLRTPDGDLREVVGTRTWTEARKVYNLTVEGIHTYYVAAGDAPILVHNVGGMEGCGDAAYNGTLHIRDEAEAELKKTGKTGSHHFDMTDDQLADYLDGFAGRGDGAPMKNGGKGWYDRERGVVVIQRNEYSMTAYKDTFEAFKNRLAKS
ncbi:polymorphic toxin-type HINT domain-containing protein [Streptomyces sp. NPDC090442]|uniref:polymorphic toxin-type HINT domain-containing protein n=1 Tax=Streptomyces sp. NPDC090442 TaxID=3365962 RepID=UPI003829C7BE